MRWICYLGVLAGAFSWAGSVAGYQPAPPQVCYYNYQVIDAYRGLGCTMPASFVPGPICCESTCCCCLHVWDDYCQPKHCGCHFRCGAEVPACEGGQPVCPGCVP